MGRTLIFFHVFCLQSTPAILIDQVNKIHFSGTYDAVDAIYCFCAGDEGPLAVCVDILKHAGSKFRIEQTAVGDRTYERFTLERIHTYVQPEDKLLYLHTKGVTKPTSLPVNLWRTYMEFFLLRRHKECLEALDTHDAVGLNWHVAPQPHFSGNMWWCTGAYFLSLPRTIGPGFCDPEFFIGLNKPRCKVLMDSIINHYHEPFFFSQYVDSKEGGPSN